MDIKHELRLPQRLRPETQHRSDIDRFEDRVHRYAIAIADQAGEVRRLAVHQDQVYLCMRNAYALDHVLHGSRHEELLLHNPISLAERQVIIDRKSVVYGKTV